MLTSSVRGLGAALAIVLVVQPMQAQDTGTRVTLTVSPGFVTFNRFGSFGTAIARLSVSRDFTPNTGGEVALFTVGLLGGATTDVACAPGGTCQGGSTPSAFSGFMVSGYSFAGSTPLRAMVGAGAVRASGGDGPGARSSAAGMVGLEWIPRTNSSFAPTIGIRVAQFASPILGARQLFLPGVGLSF